MELRYDLPKEAAHDMLEQSHSLLLHELSNHVTQHCPNSIESLVSRADVCEADVIKENLLYDKDRDGLAQLGASLHDAKAKRNNLCSEEEVNDIG